MDVAERVAAVVDFVDLGGAVDRTVGRLSGGQRERASQAAALVHEPKVLFLDEPTAGVDPELRHTFWLRFRELADGGVTLLVSTHQMDEAAHCDRATLLRFGQALVAATPHELVLASGATVTVVMDGGERLEHHLASPARDLPRMLRTMGLDPSVTGIEIEPPSPEDAILGLIEQQDGTP